MIAREDITGLVLAGGLGRRTSSDGSPNCSATAALPASQGSFPGPVEPSLATNTASLFTSQSGAYRFVSLSGQLNIPV